MLICIKIKLFAVLREKTGESEATLELPTGATVGAAAAEIGRRFPPLRDWISKTAFAVNREYAKADQLLSDGDELALIPAVSGGIS